MKKAAVVLLAMGGPDSLESVEPFLFNLFQDKAILGIPQPVRSFLAKYLSKKRTPHAKEIYAKIGGASPLPKNTQAQAAALEKALNETSSDPEFKVFVSMRYWHPFSTEAVEAVKEYAPEEIILLPLYPQFSTATTKSSIIDWQEKARRNDLQVNTHVISCYPQERGFIKALADETTRAYNEARSFGNPRILFSAHGLPEKTVRAGDRYPAQCAETVEALLREIKIEKSDSVLCFQSRVGPMKWIGPYTDAEIARAGRDKVPVVVVPISFVSEHAETLVELDITYRALAKENGVPFFIRVPTVGTAPAFINGLVQIVRDARTQG